MPRKSLPKYSHHKGSGQAFVRLDGKNRYLGVYGTPESHKKYAAELSQWQARQTTTLPDLAIGKLSLLFLEHAGRYYVKGGQPSGHLHVVRNALKQLVADYRNLPASEFGSKTLTALRNSLIRKRYSRKYINDLVSVIKRMFRWAASEELAPVSVYQGLTTIGILTKGRSAARETDPVLPVPLPFVEAVEPHIATSLWGAIQFQLATGARPGEVLQLRGCDLDMSGEVWTFTPASHKTEHHGRRRIICIGPAGQELLREYLTTDLQAFVFGTKRSRGRKAYRRDSYTTAVARACREAGIPVWSPNQLRHNFATKARQAGGIEAARVTLGHSSAVTSEIYAERDLRAAREVVAKIG